nr:immunoglobulin light chain junction region [Macaca mulatta]
CQQYYSTPYSV